MAMFNAIWTLVLFIMFVGIVLWAYSSSRKKDFEEAANLPFADEEQKLNKDGEK
ncbi:cbb3-type cytochrome oxidase subunit 3 [Veronia pacifica]|uniref:Cytochrome-c oxidase n=1 Tax=Veronia pacifica TaxID=1080227 RepID=A0A1C3EER3_9GAMM|nr:cbb3-type cytochrome c oxidase subunit 3 [Veronia pacifica]ODA31747.1 cytochrome-c oxidase [Veronia pacifica]